jgi:ATP-dependent RNA helicase DeaD
LHEAETAILFCATRENVRHLHASLTERGFNVVALSGEHSQSERNHALQALRDRRARVCVATDVAARGIDLPNLSLVVHVELPRDAEGLQHRSGRTGRAGRKGTAVLIVPYQRRKRVESMLRGAKIEADWIKVPTAADIRAKDHERLLETLLTPVEVEDEDRALGAKLLETMSAEDIAAALVRVHRAKMPQAEDMLDDGSRSTERSKESHREGFDDSVWFKMNVGRRNNADPKWILPLLCRRGGVTKNDIGAIRITADETHVGIAAAAAAKFSKAIAQPGHDEDNDVEIIRAEGPPREAARENKRRGQEGGRDGGRPQRAQLGVSSGGPRGDGPRGGGPRGEGGPRRDGARPFHKPSGPPSKHGVKHKAKGNRPR